MATPTLIMCAGGNRRFAESAIRHGWRYGLRLPGTAYAPVVFADQNWKRPDRQRYMAALAAHRPVMATVLDLERADQLSEVLDWAAEATQYAQTIIIIPKVCGVIDCIPAAINGASVVLGYSVPTTHGGTDVPLWEFGRRPVHLLGGSPHRQMALTRYLHVVSADGNMASKMANRCQFWRHQKGAKGHWVNLREIGRGDKYDAPYSAFELSMANIMEAWRKQ